MRDILLAGEKAHHRPALLRAVIADRATQHRVPILERIEECALGCASIHVERHLVADPRECAQMMREPGPDHGSVCASTHKAAGRSRTVAVLDSPPSGEA